MKPGLSSFVGRPHEAAASVQELLATAISIVPLKLRGRTPIVLKVRLGLGEEWGWIIHLFMEYMCECLFCYVNNGGLASHQNRWDSCETMKMAYSGFMKSENN